MLAVNIIASWLYFYANNEWWVILGKTYQHKISFSAHFEQTRKKKNLHAKRGYNLYSVPKLINFHCVLLDKCPWRYRRTIIIYTFSKKAFNLTVTVASTNNITLAFSLPFCLCLSNKLLLLCAMGTNTKRIQFCEEHHFEWSTK